MPFTKCGNVCHVMSVHVCVVWKLLNIVDAIYAKQFYFTCAGNYGLNMMWEVVDAGIYL